MTVQEIIRKDMQFKVYIIESQKPEEILNQIEEGSALFHALKLARIPVKYFKAVNLETLKSALSNINDEADDSCGKRHVVPIIHFSSHGNENGVALTSGEFLKWDDLSSLLLPINNKHKKLLTICMSCCKGAYGFNMAKVLGQKNVPFLALIGPQNDIGWADSLTAYIAFYHLVVTKTQPAQIAVEVMNLSAGLENEFKIFAGTAVSKNCLKEWLVNRLKLINHK